VREIRAHEQFVMSAAEGPFPMETPYSWNDAEDGGTIMKLRNRGEPSGFASVSAPLMARACGEPLSPRGDHCDRQLQRRHRRGGHPFKRPFRSEPISHGEGDDAHRASLMYPRSRV
jgi:hypothetical protein